MRGKAPAGSNPPPRRRITPAHAGKRRSLFSSPLLVPGSPPHMRGKGSPPPCYYVRGGITPAHAGKSARKLYESIYGEDHPRTCGEKLPIIKVFQKSLGSPPHMRGKGVLTVPTFIRKRITPAHAGKSRSSKNFLHIHQDHPRTCGEKTHYPRFRGRLSGSPPHMRGKDIVVCDRSYSVRITPAHAGKSFILFC